MIDQDKMRALAKRLHGIGGTHMRIIDEATDAIGLLLAEVEAANRELELSKLRIMGSNAAVESITKLVEQLRAELEAAAADKRDAGRYRHLRSAPDNFDILFWATETWKTVSADSLDDLIDGDLAQRQEGK